MNEREVLPRDLISLKHAANLVCNTHINAIRRWIHKKRLRAYVTPGKGTRVSRADILRLMNQRQETTKEK